MLSYNLRALEFSEWHDFNLTSFVDLKENLPEESGVYAIRDRKEFGRFIKTSDILYIGEAPSTLKDRVCKYSSPDKSRTTNARIHAWLNRYNSFQISWKVCEKAENSNRAEAPCRILEKRLLLEYEQDHGELPPFNCKH